MKRGGERKKRKQTMDDVPLGGKTVLLHADLAIPHTDEGKLTSLSKVRVSAETIRRLQQKKCKIVVISHTHGERDSLEPAAAALAVALGTPVRFVNQPLGVTTRMAVKRAPSDAIIVLESLSSHYGEQAADEGFAAKLASDTGARFYIHDSPSSVRRHVATSVSLPLFLPSVAGPYLDIVSPYITGAPGLVSLLDARPQIEYTNVI